jgi:hypothetical protein
MTYGRTHQLHKETKQVSEAVILYVYIFEAPSLTAPPRFLPLIWLTLTSTSGWKGEEAALIIGSVVGLQCSPGWNGVSKH